MRQILPVAQLQYRKTVTRQTETVPMDGEVLLPVAQLQYRKTVTRQTETVPMDGEVLT